MTPGGALLEQLEWLKDQDWFWFSLWVGAVLAALWDAWEETTR